MIFFFLSFFSFGFSAEYGRVNASALNIRVGPGTENHRKCVAPNASELQIKERQGKWYRVDVSSITACRDAKVSEGWVYGSPLFQPQGKYQTAQVVRAPNGLRVRTNESSQSSIRCNLKQGDHISVIGPSEKNPNWLRINTENLPGCNAKEAFVYRDYVEEFRTYTYVERNPPIPDGMDPMDGRETEGATCVNCDKSGARRNLYTEFTDYLYALTDTIKSATDSNPTKSMIERYSQSPEVDHLIRCARRNVMPGPTGWCYRYVKNALLGGNLTDEYLNGVPAKGAGAALMRQGYKNIINLYNVANPYDAPKGAILVYDRGEYGHIEIKTGEASEGGFISDYYSESAFTGRVGNGRSGRGATLIGVYVKDIKEGEKSDKDFHCPRPARD
jgi:hypothetical protein